MINELQRLPGTLRMLILLEVLHRHLRAILFSNHTRARRDDQPLGAKDIDQWHNDFLDVLYQLISVSNHIMSLKG